MHQYFAVLRAMADALQQQAQLKALWVAGELTMEEYLQATTKVKNASIEGKPTPARETAADLRTPTAHRQHPIP